MPSAANVDRSRDLKRLEEYHYTWTRHGPSKESILHVEFRKYLLGVFA
jgi:hypothetical protein